MTGVSDSYSHRLRDLHFLMGREKMSAAFEQTIHVFEGDAFGLGVEEEDDLLYGNQYVALLFLSKTGRDGTGRGSERVWGWLRTYRNTGEVNSHEEKINVGSDGLDADGPYLRRHDGADGASRR